MRFSNCLLVVFSLISFSLMATDALPVISESMDQEAWRNFAKVGCGYYPIPEELKKYIPSTLDLANSLNASCKDQYGYSSEPKLQVEILLLEKKDWSHYPQETNALAQGMNEVAVSVLLNVLQALEINPELYPKVTGGLSNLEGKNFFKVAHYDATKDLPGFVWHKDIRWITVLFINQEGLQGKVDGKVIDVSPREGYFVVNLGVFFEAFINDQEKLTAFEHQVQQVSKDRVSFGIFCSGDYPEKGFYQLLGQDICWKNTEEMQRFLVEDKSQSFVVGPHKIFDDSN